MIEWTIVGLTDADVKLWRAALLFEVQRGHKPVSECFLEAPSKPLRSQEQEQEQEQETKT